MVAVTGSSTYSTVGDSNGESEVLLEITKSSNLEVLVVATFVVGLISVIDPLA